MTTTQEKTEKSIYACNVDAISVTHKAKNIKEKRTGGE